MGQTQKYGLRYPENDGYVRETASYIKNLAEDVENKMPQGGSGEIIQEDGTASETNVYSAVAVDNKLKTNIVAGQEVATNYYEDGKRVYIMKIQLNGATATKRNEYIKTAISGLSNVRVIDIRGIAIHPNGATSILPSSNPSNCLSINYHKSNSTTENAIEIFCNTTSWAEYTLEFKIYYTKNT